MSRRLVLLGEGEGDRAALPVLVDRLLREQQAWDALHVDSAPLKVGNVHDLAKGDFADWTRYLQVAMRRRNTGAVLAVFDGDAGEFPVKSRVAFCAAQVAAAFARLARERVGAGAGFSLAVVFACQEYESWLIAGMESLTGQTLGDGRRVVLEPGAVAPAGDLEQHPRNAKGWLAASLTMGYSPTRDQAGLTQKVGFKAIRDRGLRSFRRLEQALAELVEANRTQKHVCTPGC